MALILLLFLSFALSVPLHAAAPSAEALGQITLTAYPQATPLPLASLRGHPVVLNFWAPWCVPCRTEFPEMDTLQSDFAAKGLRVLGVTAEQDPRKIAAFLKKVPVAFPIAQDPQSRLHQLIELAVMPTTLLLDAQGRVLHRYEGYSRTEGLAALRRDIAALP